MSFGLVADEKGHRPRMPLGGIVMCGRPARVKSNLIDFDTAGCGHVSGLLARPDAAAGLDAIHGLAPNHVIALNGAKQCAGSAGPRLTPSRHQIIVAPNIVALCQSGPPVRAFTPLFP
jgi:hypothetical protein